MNSLIAHIQANMGGLLPYEACLPKTDLTIGDTLRPYVDCFPSASEEPPARIMQNGYDNEVGVFEHRRRMDRNPYLQKPNFFAVPKRSPRPLASRKASTPPPLHITQGMWIGIGAILRHFEATGRDISGYLELPLNESGLDAVLAELDEECRKRNALHGRGGLKAAVSIVNNHIDLTLPSCYCEDEHAYLIEMFFFGFRDRVIDHLDCMYETCDDDEPGYFSPDDRKLINEVGWEKIVDTYFETKSEDKSFDLDGLESERDRLGEIVMRHPVLEALTPEIVTEVDVFFSLQEPSDIPAYLDYTEAFNAVVDKMPEWVFEYGCYGHDGFMDWVTELVEFYKKENGITTAEAPKEGEGR